MKDTAILSKSDETLHRILTRRLHEECSTIFHRRYIDMLADLIDVARKSKDPEFLEYCKEFDLIGESLGFLKKLNAINVATGKLEGFYLIHSVKEDD